MALSSESTVLIDLSYRYLNGSMVLRLDDSVGSAALSWDIAGDESVFMNSQIEALCTHRSTSSPLSFSILAIDLQ